MNPMLLSFLQNAAQQQQAAGQAWHNQQIQEAQASPEAQQATDQQQQQPFDLSPIVKGNRAAMQAARDSFGPSEEDRRRAMGFALMNFFSNMSKPGYGPGFAGRLHAINQSFSPAMEAYQTALERAQANNMGAYNQIYKEAMDQRAHEQRLAERKEMAEHRKEQLALQRQSLGETRRYHSGMLDMKREKLRQQQAGGDMFGLPPIASKNERLLYAKDRKNLGATLKEVTDLNKEIKEYEKLIENDTFNPMDPNAGGIIRSVKDVIGGRFPNSHAGKERVARRKLDAALLRFRTAAERNLKGGVLSNNMAKRFEDKNALPSLNESMLDLKAKMKGIEKELAERYKAADLSMRHGVHVSPDDLNKFEAPQEEARTEAPAPEASPAKMPQLREGEVAVQDSTGKIWAIPQSKLQEAIAQGGKPL